MEAIGKAFHRRGPATPNARSPRHVQVRGTKHVTASDHQMTVVDGDRQRFAIFYSNYGSISCRF